MDDKQLKQAVLDAHCIPGWDFFVTATLHPGCSRVAIEDALYAWAARVNRYYLGREWGRLGNDKMQGIVFFEKHPDPHAHMIIQPPAGASRLHFAVYARDWFYKKPWKRNVRPRPVTMKGNMKVDWLRTDVDRVKTMGYSAKHLEWGFDRGDWKYLDQLSPRQVV